jgi:hypothetical protein
LKALRGPTTRSTGVRLRPFVEATFVGVTCTLVGVAVTIYSLNEFDAGLPGKVLLWPAWLLLEALPCFNMGTPGNPICEGTPVHLSAGIIGLIATVAFYALLFHAVDRIRKQQ